MTWRSALRRYHICVLSCAGDDLAGIFLYLNSRSGFEGDFVLIDTEIPCLPRSATGKTIVSFAQPLRRTRHQLELFRAKKLGELPVLVARKLEPFARSVMTLNKRERQIILAALASLI
jgi:hypothetical protein